MTEVFKEILQTIYDNDLSLIALRYKKINIDSIYKGDYDFLSPLEDMDKTLEIIFNVLSKNSICFTIDKRKYGKTKIVIFNTEKEFIIMEIWNYLETKDPFQLTAKYIHWEDIKSFIYNTGSENKLNIEIEALYYLSHMQTKSKSMLSDEVLLRLEYYKNSTVDKKEIFSIFEMLLMDQDIKKASHSANKILLKRNIVNKKSFNDLKVLKIKWDIKLNKVYSKILKFLKIVPCIGPDGVGKTTLIEEILNHDSSKRIQYFRFKKLFRKSLIYKLFYKFNKKKLEKLINTKVEKNEVDDFQGTLVVLSALTHYPFVVLINILQNKIIFSDRFFQDFLLEDIRFNNKDTHLRNNWKFLLRLIPNTYWHVQMDAPSEVIFERKQELTILDIDLYRTLMFKLYLKKPSIIYTYINTKNDLNECKNILEKEAKNNGFLR